MEISNRYNFVSLDSEDYKHFIGMALRNKMTFKALIVLFDDMTSTLDKSKQLNNILLEQLEMLHLKLQKKDENHEAENRILESDIIEVSNTETEKINENDTFSEKGLQNEENIYDQIQYEKDCHICGERFETVEAYDTHAKSHEFSEEEDETSYEIKQRESEQETTTYNGDENFDGELPEKKVRKKDPLTLKYHCQYCSKKCKSISELKIHERFHTGEKPFNCNHCSKSFHTKSELNRHERSQTGEKPYKCNFCDRQFVQKYQLTVHESLHTSEKTYECKICQKNFGHKFKLKRHERIHTEEKSYVCKYCEKSFVKKSQLEKHEIIHTGEKAFGCKSCDKNFVNKANLKIHERIHTGEKPYGCNHCDKSFNQKAHLENHVSRIHTGEKPYECRFCEKCFFKKDKLKNHEKSHKDV